MPRHFPDSASTARSEAVLNSDSSYAKQQDLLWVGVKTTMENSFNDGGVPVAIQRTSRDCLAYALDSANFGNISVAKKSDLK